MAAFALSIVMAEWVIHITPVILKTFLWIIDRKGHLEDHHYGDGKQLIFWLTCSEILFDSCKEGLYDIIKNSDSNANLWRDMGVPDTPKMYDPDSGLMTVDHDGNECSSDLQCSRDWGKTWCYAMDGCDHHFIHDLCWFEYELRRGYRFVDQWRTTSYGEPTAYPPLSHQYYMMGITNQKAFEMLSIKNWQRVMYSS